MNGETHSITHNIVTEDYALLKFLTNVFSSKEYSKAVYTRAELQDLMETLQRTAMGNHIDEEIGTEVTLTNPERKGPLITSIEDDYEGNPVVVIEGMKIYGLPTHDTAREFIQSANQNVMAWKL